MILFFTKGNKGVASSRFRVWYVAERLKKNYGWNYEIIHSLGYSFWLPSVKRFKIFKKVFKKLKNKDYKIIFVHKSLFPFDVVLLIILIKRFFKKKLIYDLDDAEWLHSGPKSRMLAKNASLIFCGSHEILNWAKKYNKNAILIPTCVDHKLYKNYAINPVQKTQYNLIWEGAGRGHWKSNSIKILKPIFEILRQKNINFRFVLIGSQNFEPLRKYFSRQGYPVIFVDELDWDNNPAAIPEELKKHEADIGLAPLRDTPFERAKCAFKAIEYMACGLPVVASPVGENKIVVQEGLNGFCAASPEEWAEKIIIILSNLGLRKKMSRNALNTVEKNYSYQFIIPRVNKLLKEILN